MNSIMISGTQGKGKTTLAKMIADAYQIYQVHDIESFDEKELTSGTHCLILEGIDKNHLLEKFRAIVSKQSFMFRPRFKSSTITVTPALIIGVTQLEVQPNEIRHCFVYRLS